MATNVLDEECCSSNVVFLSSQPNFSFFQDSNTDLVSEVTAECINFCATPEIKGNCAPKSKYHIGSGSTCCIPTCFNNTVRNKEFSFYVIPKENQLRSKWLFMLRRKNFVPCIISSSSLFSPFCWRQENKHEQHSDLKYASYIAYT